MILCKKQSTKKRGYMYNKQNIYSTQDKDLADCKSVYHKPLIPFVHKFQTKANKYLFDVNTNRVLRVDSVTWEIIKEFGMLNKEAIVKKYSWRFNISEISSVYDDIADAQQRRNLFLAKRPLRVMLAEEKQVQEAVENKRQILTLCVTEDCNFRCTYCVYGGGYTAWHTHSTRKMSFETAVAAIDDFIKHSSYYHNNSKDVDIRSIGFYGGEPLLNFELIKKCVIYVKQKMAIPISFHIVTNGSLLIGEIAEFLASENFLIEISLDGPSHIHNICRHFSNGLSTWDLVTKNIRNFVDRYPKYKSSDTGAFLTISTVLSPFTNALDVDDFFSFHTMESLHCNPYFIVTTMSDLNSYYINTLAPEDRRTPGIKTLRRKFLDNIKNGEIGKDPTKHEWKFQRALFEEPFRHFINRQIASLEPFLDSGIGPRSSTCILGHSRSFVSVDGNYYPCERVPESEEFKLGNVRDGINHVKSYYLIRKLISLRKDMCNHCWCANFCRVGCVSNIRNGGNITAKAKQRACNNYRSNIHRMLIELFEILESNPQAFDYLKKV